MDQWWSWILTAVGLTGFILAGRKVWWCWYINIGCQALWFAYAIVTEQYGFIVAALAYTFVFTKNAIAWTREHFDETEGWDFNDYPGMRLEDPELQRLIEYATNDAETTEFIYDFYPKKVYCYGGIEGVIHPKCPIHYAKHVTHTWIETDVTS